MAHFLAPSNALLLPSEEGGEFYGEVRGGIHAGVRGRFVLNYKVGSCCWVLLLPDPQHESCDIILEPPALKLKNNGEDSRNSPKNSSRTLQALTSVTR